MTVLLKAEGLTISYKNDVKPIENLSLEIHKGDFLCLLGPSGIGKTTLLKALVGVIKPSAGQVLYKGREITKPGTNVVLLFQENNLYPWLSVERNIAFALEVARRPKEEIASRVQYLLAMTQLTEARRQFPHQLSGGMRRRACIARALACEPDVLLMDEPFSSVDFGLKRQMYAFMDYIRQRTGTTIVMVTHDIEEALMVSQTCLFLDRSGITAVIDAKGIAGNSKAFFDIKKEIEKLFEQNDNQNDFRIGTGNQCAGVERVRSGVFLKEDAGGDLWPGAGAGGVEPGQDSGIRPHVFRSKG